MYDNFREAVKELIDNNIVIAESDKSKLLSLIESFVDFDCRLDFADIKSVLPKGRKFTLSSVCGETFEKTLEKLNISNAKILLMFVSGIELPLDNEKIELIRSKTNKYSQIVFAYGEAKTKEVTIEIAQTEYTKEDIADEKNAIEIIAKYKERNERERTSFTRRFDKIERLKNEKLFAQLKADIEKGEVFPAVRAGFIDFYCKGGCLYRYGGFFKRDEEYKKPIYQQGTDNLDEYKKAKKQNENKNTSKSGLITERQLLDKLNKHTFNPNRKTKVVVLDIEARFSDEANSSQKCDMVLLNTKTNEIMFVEGKVFKDKRVNVKAGFTPEVIKQVNMYTSTITEQSKEIVNQYGEHIRIINELFETNYNPKVKLIKPAKLLVYGTPIKPNTNGKAVIERVNLELGNNNVLWIYGGGELGIDEIWSDLCK